MIAARADLFREMHAYLQGASTLVAQVRESDPAPGFAEVLAPGDLESRTRASYECDGIPLHDDVWRGLTETASALGVATT